MTARRQKTPRKPAPDIGDFRVRRARAEDREAILEMSKHIWGGHDYMPLVWDKWLAEKSGALMTATINGRPVGTTKISLLAPGEVWLEGLRLHPDYHGLGLSRKIHRATFRVAESLKPRTIRYSTWIGNEASRRIAEKNDFWQIARTGWMWGKVGRRSSVRSRVATLDDLDAVVRFVQASSCYEATGGVAGVGWTFPELKRRRIRQLVALDRVLILPRSGPPRAVAIYDIGKIDNDVCLGFVDGPDRDVTALAKDTLAVAAATGRDEASAMLPMGRLVDLTQAAGFDEWQPVRAVVYERGARGLARSPETFEEMLTRTLQASDTEMLDAVAGMLMERAPVPLLRENVRDFVARNLIPDTDRVLIACTQGFFEALNTDLLRTILRGVIEHLYQHHGLVGDSMTATDSAITVRHRGRRLAVIRARATSLHLTLGPGFGACFARGLKVRAGEIRFDDRTLDRSSGRYGSITLVLSERSHVEGAGKAIDIIMKSARSGATRK